MASGSRPPRDAQVAVPAPAVPASNKKKLRQIAGGSRVEAGESELSGSAHILKEYIFSYRTLTC